MTVKKTLFTDVSKISAEDILQHEIHSSALFMHMVESIDQYFEKNTVTEHMVPYIKSNLFVNLSGRFLYDYTPDDWIIWIKQLLASLTMNSGEEEKSPPEFTTLQKEKMKAGIAMMGKNYADSLKESVSGLEMTSDEKTYLSLGIIAYMRDAVAGTIPEDVQAYQKALEVFLESRKNNST